MPQFEVNWRDGDRKRKIVTPAESAEEAQARAILHSEGYASEIEVEEVRKFKNGH